ncbi:DNA-binding protein [Actimicrobium antarcticum]|uniref:KfrA N-terminal DNA-binding domain-containing protein n=1 Tax=Actimicrobium antarcticum TaxID=1051899 RepID=A0ABP7SHW8_9BURK
MARAGIVYSHVANAAAQLAADGRNPTVDTVRAALGNTGSKTTIAPLLKRWKDEHQDTVSAAESGLPSALLQAMKGVHDKLQGDVQLQLEQAHDAHHVALQLAAEATRQAEDESRILLNDKAALREEVVQLKAELSTLRTDHQMLVVRQASLQSDNAGLLQRLTDRAAEVTALNRQLTQSRAQFDHFVAASVEQRTQERQATDQHSMRLEQNLAAAQQRLLQQQASVVQQHTQTAQLQEQVAGLQNTAQTLQSALESCRAERDQLTYQHAQLSSTAQTTAQQLDTAQEAAIAARIQVAIQARELVLMAQQVTQADRDLKELDQSRLTLIQERAELQARVLQAARQASAPGAV